jgi:hypothetical protein
MPMPHRMSCAAGASGTETDATSPNGCLMSGTSPLIQRSPRKSSFLTRNVSTEMLLNYMIGSGGAITLNLPHGRHTVWA